MKKLKDNLFLWFVKAVLAWTVFALSFQVTMMTLMVVKPELATKIGNEIMWKLDGTFKDSPDNIWYKSPKTK
jgi:hypothetical protein